MKEITSSYNNTIAPCGLLCNLCLAFQRSKNRCDGCNSTGEKPLYCLRCAIKNCEMKKSNASLICYECAGYPCKRLKDLDKRYRTKYGESLIENFRIIKEKGVEEFLKEADKIWKCKACGNYLCVHRGACPRCGAKNPHYPSRERK